MLIRGALILSFTSSLSYVLGLLRDRVLAGTFGASHELDAYQASFIVPDFLFNLLVAGALSAAFIPIFTDLRTHHKNKIATQLAGNILAVGLLVLLVASLISFIFADPITTLVAPGFDQEKHELHVLLTRTMLIAPIIFLISNLLGGMLVSSKRFIFYGLSPALYNLGIIIGAVFFAPTLGVLGVALGTIIGGLLHLSIRLIDIRRAGLAFLPTLKFAPEFRKVITLMMPRIVGLTAVQIQLWAFIAIASNQGEGAVTIYSMARNFQSFPVSFIGIAFATSLFPLLAESKSRKSYQQFNRQLRQGALATLAAVIPASILIYILREEIIAFFLGTGNFDQAAVASTAAVLGIYTLSIPTESLVHILVRAFYALHNTLVPVVISVISIVVIILSATILTRTMGVSGIAAGFAIGTAGQVLLLIVALRLLTKRMLAR